LLTNNGCKAFSTITRGYEPLSSYVEFKKVAILRGDSTIQVPLDGVLDLPAPQSGIYWGDRLKMLQLPRLEVGDGIEIETFRKGYSYALLDERSPMPEDSLYIPPMPGEYFDVVLFEADVPIEEKKYVLMLPSDKRLHSRVYDGPMFSGTSFAGDTTVYAWWAREIPAHEYEPNAPDASDVVMKVVLATVESWEAKSRWFFEVNEPQFGYTDAIKAKVDEILAAAGVGNGSDEQKAFELVHWVAQNIRYSGQTMGKGEGYTLHPGAMIFEQRSGVCKDIAGMLITMMRAAGLDSYGAMTMAGSRIEEVPADQFNHCVVALRKSDGSFGMYDPTWVPYYRDIWSKLEAEQHYLIGSPKGESLSRITYSPPEESPLKISSTCRILGDGSIEGMLYLEGGGYFDSRLRRLLSRAPRPEILNTLGLVLGNISERIEVLSYEHGGLADFKRNMWWRINYRVPEYSLPVGNRWEFRSPMMQLIAGSSALFGVATYDWPEKRHDDLYLWSSQLLDAHETITLPGGYNVIHIPKDTAIEETFASFHGESSSAANKCSIALKAALNRRQVPPDGYAGVRKVLMEFKTYASSVFRSEKGGTR